MGETAADGTALPIDPNDPRLSNAGTDLDVMSHHSHATSHHTGASRGSRASRSRVTGSKVTGTMHDNVSDVEEIAEEKKPTFLQAHNNKG